MGHWNGGQWCSCKGTGRVLYLESKGKKVLQEWSTDSRCWMKPNRWNRKRTETSGSSFIWARAAWTEWQIGANETPSGSSKYVWPLEREGRRQELERDGWQSFKLVRLRLMKLAKRFWYYHWVTKIYFLYNLYIRPIGFVLKCIFFFKFTL